MNNEVKKVGMHVIIQLLGSKISSVKFQISSCCTRVIVERSPNPSTLALK
jgi:hypothetical protein